MSVEPIDPSPSVPRPDRIVLVYDGDSGLQSMLLDVVKKAVGREECALCEITYSPIGKRDAWRACERRLGVVVDELHRDRLPTEWNVSRTHLPCVLGRVRDERPFILVTNEEIRACRGSIDQLELVLTTALGERRGVR